ncbi:MAG: D-3-phosphoglycerate dehydrogenase / 2-oxoglutarate reductase [Bacillota bacterium]|nr:D-3-phosphoglycerate dehydrogenase / 2-oxoglutarate reductase [Bacillota bacterium]
MKPKVVVVQRVHQAGLDLLAQEAEWVLARDPAPEKLVEDVKDADAILVRTTPITREVLEAAPRLKVVGRHGVGVDNIDVAAATELGIPVVYAPGSNTLAVAEHAVMLMLALAKNVFSADRALRTEHNFASRFTIPSTELAGKTLGLIGFGKIGQAVAKRCGLGFEMRVIAYDPYLNAEAAKALDVTPASSVDEVLEQADVVSLHAPATPENYHLIGREQLQKMRPHALLINTARGPLVDEKALYEALKAGRIAGAGLDVFDPEPPEPSNPLFELPNVIVTPHMAAHTDESLRRMATWAAEGILQVLRGEYPTRIFNPEVWERRRR